MSSPSYKLYCYLEETGQDTQGKIFVVTMVISDKNHWQLMNLCEAYERISHKGWRKGHGTDPQPRLEFMLLVIEDDRFRGVLCYAKLLNHTRPDFKAFMVTTLGEVITTKLRTDHYLMEAWIDGLSKAKQTQYATSLRDQELQNVHLHRVRREDSNALVRLTDVLAGRLRDALETKYLQAVRPVQRGYRSGNIVEV